MSFIHEYSDECTSSQLDLFKIPSTVTAVEYEKFVDFKPSASLSSSTWVEFPAASNEEFVDLSSIYIDVELSITASDGKPLPSAAAAQGAPPNLFNSIVPPNNFLSSLFQQLDIYLSNTLVTSATNLYHYRSYLDTLFYQSKHAKQTYLYSGLWEKDADKRKERIKSIYNGKTIKMCGPLHFDLAQQERLLLNFVDMRFRLNVADPSVILRIDSQTTDRPRINLINATLFVCKKKLFADCEAGVLTALQKATVKYFYTNTSLRHRIIDSGSSSYFFDHIFPSTLPRRFIVGLVTAKAFNGDWESDPYDFSHKGVVEARAFVDALQLPTPGILLDMQEDDFARAYHLFFRSMYATHSQSSLAITPDDFKKNCCFYCWTLSPDDDIDDQDTVAYIRRGHVKIDFRFKKATTEHLVAIIYSHFPQVLQIDANRTVMLESI